MLEEIVVKTGARAIDDRRKISIEGAIVRPDSKHRDIGILLVIGWNIFWEHYIEYFSKHIGMRWPIYTIQSRNLGWASGNTLVNDIVQVDEYARDRLETDKLIYFGHSMGIPVAVAASKSHGRQVLGYLGMATYPSWGDCWNRSPNINKTNRAQSFTNAVGEKLNFGPLACPLRSSGKLNAPSYFVIAKDDELLLSRFFPENIERFKNYFEELGGETSIIPGNHVFNKRLFKLRPYNKDNPRALLQQAFYFMERLIGD